MTSIPRIIHQTWKSREIPQPLQTYRQTWLNHHPDWEYRFYDDLDCRRFVKKFYPHLIVHYDNYPRQIQRTDMFRYLVIHTFGGLYADMDMECYKPLDPLLNDKKAVFSVEAHLTKRRQQELEYKNPIQIANCIFAAVPGLPVFDKIIGRLCELASQSAPTDESVESITGPRMLTRLFEDLDITKFNEVDILKQIHLMPSGYPHMFPFKLLMYANHHNAGTWKNKGKTSSFGRIWIERNKLPSLW